MKHFLAPGIPINLEFHWFICHHHICTSVVRWWVHHLSLGVFCFVKVATKTEKSDIPNSWVFSFEKKNGHSPGDFKVPFSSLIPDRWRSLNFTPWVRVTWTHHPQKGHGLNHQTFQLFVGRFFFSLVLESGMDIQCGFHPKKNLTCYVL